mgnify:CR=1 FL=1
MLPTHTQLTNLMIVRFTRSLAGFIVMCKHAFMGFEPCSSMLLFVLTSDRDIYVYIFLDLGFRNNPILEAHGYILHTLNLVNRHRHLVLSKKLKGGKG